MAGILVRRPWIGSNGPINTWHIKGGVVKKSDNTAASGIKVVIGIVTRNKKSGKTRELTREATTDTNGKFDRLFIDDLWLTDEEVISVTVVLLPPKKTFHAGDWGQTFPGDGKAFSPITTNTNTVWDDRPPNVSFTNEAATQPIRSKL